MGKSLDLQKIGKDLTFILRKVARQFAPFNRESVAHAYLRGEGIEIGALHNHLRVPRAARVKYVDRCSVTGLRKQYPEFRSRSLVNVDIIDDGECLSTLQDGTQDFVIANHFIEHCQNPLKAIRNMFRVLKPGGILYVAIPDKRYTFDADRPVTPLEHLIRDYREGPQWSEQGHLEEWTKMAEKVLDGAEAQRKIEHLKENGYSIHYHVWTQVELMELILGVREILDIKFEIELFLAKNDECLFVLKKTD